MNSPFLRALQRPLGAAIIALVVAASPVLAQPSNEFTIGTPPQAPDASFFASDGGETAPPPPLPDTMARSKPPAAERADCLTDRQVRRGLRGHEFDNIEIGRRLSGNVVEVMANYGGSLYRMKLDRCSGRVSDVTRMRRNGLGGFGLQFGF